MTGPVPLTLLADDLTGALDAAAPFAAPGAPVTVLLGQARAGLVRMALSTETRDGVGPGAAAARVAALMAARRTDRNGLWFKKIDSMLRGPWAAEVAAAAAGFAQVVVAPAFPEMGRRTVGGVQQALPQAGGTGWRPVGPPLVGTLRAAGLSARPWQPGAPAARGEVLVADAVTPGDLDAVAAAPGLAADVLWVGSAGLAEALGGRPGALSVPPPDLMLVGTAHPVTRAQTDRVRRTVPDQRLEEPGLGLSSPAEARAALRRTLGRLLEGDAPHAILVTGGATLASLARAAGTDRLDVLGRLAPGLPVSRLVGGRWDGVVVTSKSGGFGAADLLVRLAAGDPLATADG